MNNRLLSVLSIKPFLFLWLAEIFSQIAMNMVNFMLLIVAYELTNSNTAVSGIVLSFTIPAILFGVIAGVYVDRFDKKTVLFATNVSRAGLAILLAFMHMNLFVIYLLSFGVAIATQFFIPAETPMIPNLVDSEQLLTANALFSMGVYGSIFLAYALSGPFLIFFGNKNAFLVIALVFIVASFFISLIKQKAKVRKEEKGIEPTVKGEIQMLLRIMAKTKAIYHSLFLLTFAQVIILVLAVVGPGYARHILHIPVSEFPLLFVTPATLGMIVAAVVLGNFFHKHSRDKMASWGVFLTGVSLLLFPYGSKVASKDFVHILNGYLPHILKINILHIMVVLAFIFGFASSMIFVPSNTILQEETSDEVRGKIYGALNALVGLFSLIPIIIVGSFADVFGVGSVLTGVGIIVLLVWLGRIILKR